MSEIDGEMTCVDGDMGLSVMMRLMLSDYCDNDPMPQDKRSTKVRWGVHWHCAVDGAAMSAADLHLPTCPACSRILPERILYQLIELHPHR